MSRSTGDPSLTPARDDSSPVPRFSLAARLACSALSALALLAAPASAQDAASAASAALPGSPRPPGAGLSPEAPHAGPAAGGRAPSFGAPVKKDAFAFTLGGSIFAWEAVGFGRTPAAPAPNQVSRPLHVPALVEGRQPFWSTTGGSLFMQYGNSTVSSPCRATPTGVRALASPQH